MIEVPAYDNGGARAGSVDFDEALLGGEVREDLLRMVAHLYEKRRRIGSRGTRSRGEVRSGGKKLYRQKGTGYARAGQRSVVHRRGGGVAFSLRHRVFHADMPRKAWRRACHSALLARLNDGEVSIFDSPELSEPRTSVVAGLLKQMDMPRLCLIVAGDADAHLFKSARNISGVSVCRVQDLNAYALLAPERVLFSRTAMEQLLEGLSK